MTNVINIKSKNLIKINFDVKKKLKQYETWIKIYKNIKAKLSQYKFLPIFHSKFNQDG